MVRHLKAKLRGFLERQQNREYADRLARAKRRISYEEWLQLQAKRWISDENISDKKEPQPQDSLYWPGILADGGDRFAENAEDGPDGGTLAGRCAVSQQQGLELLKEEGIWLILQRDGYVDPMAFSWIADYFREHPETQLLYGDEDALDAAGAHRCSPCFKPDWSPDTWMSCFYVGSVIALRRELVQRLAAETHSSEDAQEHLSKLWPKDSPGRLYFARPVQVRILVHQLLELAGGFGRGCDAIAHLRGMLFHMNHDAANAGVQREYRQEDGFGRPVQMLREMAYALAEIPLEGIAWEKSGIAPEREGSVSERSELVPEGEGNVSERGELAPEGERSVSERGELAPEGERSVSERGELAPEGDGIAWEKSGIAPEREGSVSERSELAPEGEGIASEKGELAPEREGIASEKRGIVSEKSELAPKRERIASEKGELAPEGDGIDLEREGARRRITVSVIIPSRDNPQILGQCLESLRKCQENIRRAEAAAEFMESGGITRSHRLEIVVIDNGSDPDNKAKIDKITHGMKYLYEPMPFNFSKMCNRGAQEASGEILLFLNDDITVCADGWLEAMVDRALRPYVGAVGLKLYYPDSSRIQHAGIANLPGGPVHKLQFTEDGQEEDHGYGSLDRNVIGVTGACLMVQRDRFREVGGFPEDLQVAYNDVELCFKLREAGWHNVVVNRFHACHHESLSRGSDLTREKMMRLRQERETLYERHPRYECVDPYYPRPLCMELGDMHVHEVYLDIRAGVQVASGCRWLAECPEQEGEDLVYELKLTAKTAPQALSQGHSQDRSLCLGGYLVVQWENNACYERYLLLRKQGEVDGAYAIHLKAMYSRDAEYGRQEQPNVAMCGFQVTLPKGLVPDGAYWVGMQARSRVGRRRLTAWTDQMVLVEDGMLSVAKNLMMAGQVIRE